MLSKLYLEDYSFIYLDNTFDILFRHIKMSPDSHLKQFWCFSFSASQPSHLDMQLMARSLLQYQWFMGTGTHYRKWSENGPKPRSESASQTRSTSWMAAWRRTTNWRKIWLRRESWFLCQNMTTVSWPEPIPLMWLGLNLEPWSLHLEKLTQFLRQLTESRGSLATGWHLRIWMTKFTISSQDQWKVNYF